MRERAFKQTLGAYLAFQNTMAATLAGSVQGDIFEARARHYGSALEAALAPDNIPVSVYDNLIATIHANLPKLHRYMEIRRRKLGIDKVHLYDTFVPPIEGAAPRIGFDDAVATIVKALAPLGREYIDPMTRALQRRWIDVYETRGKRSGAYSQSTYSTHPYILMNYTDTYDNMFTTAHEMGRSMHSWFSQHSRPPVRGDYPIFLAEVASTSNEVILGDYLRKNTKSDAERLFLVNTALEGIRGTVINQTMWAEYEKLIHAARRRKGRRSHLDDRRNKLPGCRRHAPGIRCWEGAAASDNGTLCKLAERIRPQIRHAVDSTPKALPATESGRCKARDPFEPRPPPGASAKIPPQFGSGSRCPFVQPDACRAGVRLTAALFPC